MRNAHAKSGIFRFFLLIFLFLQEKFTLNRILGVDQEKGGDRY